MTSISIITIVILLAVLIIAGFFIIKMQQNKKAELELHRINVIKNKNKNKPSKIYTPGNPENVITETPVLDSANELKKNKITPVKQENNNEIDSSKYLKESVADIAHSTTTQNLLNLSPEKNSRENDNMEFVNHIEPNRTEDEKMTILLVDDSKSSLFSAKRALERDYNIVTAIDGIEALEKMELMKPALVVTDIEMPRLDGFGLVQRMKSNIVLTEIPIIMVTGNLAKNVQIGQDKGVQGFLNKPYKQEDLLGQVNYLLDK